MNVKKWILPLILTAVGTLAFAQNGGEPEAPMYGNVYIYEDAVPGYGGEPEPTRMINASVAAVIGEGGEPSVDWDKVESIRLEHGMTEEIKDGVVYFFVLPESYKDVKLTAGKTSIGENDEFKFTKDTLNDETVLVISTKNAQGAYINIFEGENIHGKRGIQFVGSLLGEGRTLLLLPFL